MNSVQISYWQLEDAGLKPVLVVDESDPYHYRKFRHVRVRVKGIAAKRQWILDETAGPHAQLDDDLILNKVTRSGTVKLATKKELQYLFTEMLPSLMEKFAHGGLHGRGFVNYAAKQHYPYAVNRGRYFRFLAYNRSRFVKPLQFRSSKNKTAEDVYSQIDLAMQGLEWFTVVSYCYAEKEYGPERWTQEQKKADNDEVMTHYDLPDRFIKRNIINPLALLKEAKHGNKNFR
jgi:hypothetical protein